MKRTPFSKCFVKLIDDLSDACELIDKYSGGGRLVDNLKKDRKRQKKLIPALKKQTNIIQSGIELVKSKTIYDEIKNNDELEYKISYLIFDIAGATYRKKMMKKRMF
jgi:hypothetical protein